MNGRDRLPDLTDAERVAALLPSWNPDTIKLIDPEQYLAADPIRRAELQLQAVDKYQAGLVKKSP